MNEGRSNLYQDFLNAVDALFHSNNKVFKDRQINLFVILIKDLKVGIFLIKFFLLIIYQMKLILMQYRF